MTRKINLELSTSAGQIQQGLSTQGRPYIPLVSPEGREAQNRKRREVHAARQRAGVSSRQPLSQVQVKSWRLGEEPATRSTLSPWRTPSLGSSSTGATKLSTPRDVQISTSNILPRKPFRCPKPNCNKSYAQTNGLKYHMLHGRCDFVLLKDSEPVEDLSGRKKGTQGTVVGCVILMLAIASTTR